MNSLKNTHHYSPVVNEHNQTNDDESIDQNSGSTAIVHSEVLIPDHRFT